MADEATFNPEPIITTLAQHGVDFVLIGGLAAVLHGSPLYTGDADICPARNRQNLELLASALEDMDAKVYTSGAEEGLKWAGDAVQLGNAEMWNLTTRFGRIDVNFVPAGTRGFEDLIKDSVEYEVYGQSIRVASLRDVIRSKQAANRARDREQLPTLRKLQERLDTE